MYSPAIHRFSFALVPFVTPSELRDVPDQAAHYHILSICVGTSIAAHRVRKSSIITLVT
jgi:hypothetical protein